MSGRIWLSAEKHTRNESLSRELEAKLYQLEVKRLRFFRYPYLLLKSLNIIYKNKPSEIFVQNPSLLLAVFVSVVGKILRRAVIIDAHNIGVLFEHRNKIVQYVGQCLNDVSIRLAKLVIVTNSGLASTVREKGGTLFILADPFPQYSNYQRISLPGKKNVLFICSFSSDEPFLEVIKAAEYLPPDTVIHITGNYEKAVRREQVPKNVILTGYLPDSDYINYIFSCDVIVDLTTWENLLLCGAYEAIAAEKPVILSDTLALRAYFSDGALYTNNTASDIAKAIQKATNNLTVLQSNAKKAKNRKHEEWKKQKQDFEVFLSRLTDGKRPKLPACSNPGRRGLFR